MKKYYFYLFFVLVSTLQVLAQYTSIPDPVFEQLLINQGIDSDHTINGHILTDDAHNATRLNIHAITTNNNIDVVNDITGLQDFINLHYLDMSSAYINYLDLSNNVQIDTLLVSDMFMLDSINTRQNVNLKYLKLSHLKFGYTNYTKIDLSQNTQLEFLDCREASLNQLDISTLTNLHTLLAGNPVYFADNLLYFNNITTLDLTHNPNLEFLMIENTGLQNINFPQNSQLKTIYIRKQNITGFSADGLNLLETLFLNFQENLQNIDLTDAVNLKNLYINKCNLNTLPDLSHNLQLEVLYLGSNIDNDPVLDAYPDNHFQVMDFHDNPNLKTLTAKNVDLHQIDLSQNHNLESINLSFNQSLSDIDLSNNINLKTLFISHCNLSNIDVTNNINLEFLILGQNVTYAPFKSYTSNHIQNIDITLNHKLKGLAIDDNEITNIDMQNNQLLEGFLCSNNPINDIDLSLAPNLQHVVITNNPNLQTIKLKNQHNADIITAKLYNNPNLSCIEVDDAATAITGTGIYSNWEVDNYAVFSDDCSSGIDVVVEKKALQIYKDTLDYFVIITKKKINMIKVYNIEGQLIFETQSKKFKIPNSNKGLLLFKIYSDNTVFTEKYLND